MKKLVYMFIAATLVMTSCKKDKKTEPAVEETPVNPNELSGEKRWREGRFREFGSKVLKLL